jgi:hypothetical protein
MYVWPVTFPVQTNREDLLRTVSLFDDDTGSAIDFSGRTLAAPGDFTGTNWTVTDGTIITTSATSLKIKDYPFGNEMQAIAPIVGLNLGILAGDFATISDPTGKNTMSGYVVSYAPATGALVMQIGSAFEFEIRGHHHHGNGGEWGYSESAADMGVDCSSPLISAQLGNGITVIGLGVLQLRIPAYTMAKLRHRTYGAAMTMFDGSDTRQIFTGKQPIVSGGVATMPIAPAAPLNPYGLP